MLVGDEKADVPTTGDELRLLSVVNGIQILLKLSGHEFTFLLFFYLLLLALGVTQ